MSTQRYSTLVGGMLCHASAGRSVPIDELESKWTRFHNHAPFPLAASIVQSDG